MIVVFSSVASIVTSDTKGYLNHIQVGEVEMDLVNSWKAHDFESWIAAFNYADTNIIYSGTIFLISNNLFCYFYFKYFKY